MENTGVVNKTTKPTHPCISIIIPAYNEEKYLPIAIESIKAQTYKNWELIVAVSPRTTDRTKEIALNLGAKVVEGARVGFAKNNGAQAARKESTLFVFMDADVRLPNNNFLEKALQEFVTRSLDVASCPVTFNRSGIVEAIEKIPFWIRHSLETITEKYRPFPMTTL